MKERQQETISAEEGSAESREGPPPIQWSAFRKGIEEYFREQGASQQKAKIRATKIFYKMTETSLEAARVRVPGFQNVRMPETLIDKILHFYEKTDPHKRVSLTREELQKNPFNAFWKDNRQANEYLRAARAVIQRLREG
jgi:hypothetical protein